MSETYDFLAFPRESESLKEVVEVLYNKAQRISNRKILAKIGELKGLFAAYEIASSKILIETICKEMAQIILDFIDRDGRESSINISLHRSLSKEEWVNDFYEYLGQIGKTLGTKDMYLRAFKRAILRGDNPKTDFQSLCESIDDLIISYEKENPKNFTILSALKHFRDFSQVYCSKCRNYEYKIVMIEDDKEKMLWQDNCSLEQAEKMFKEILSKICEERRNNNDTSKWKSIRLYDKAGNLIRKEG